MACPYFSPTAPLPWSLWSGRLRPPLGELYDGECVARGERPYKPTQAHLAECCNLGYARSRCDRVPANGPDAIRFSIVKDDGDMCRIVHIAENEGQLAARGIIELNGRALGRLSEKNRPTIELQAGAFLESYLRADTRPSTRLTPPADVQHTENSSSAPQ